MFRCPGIFYLYANVFNVVHVYLMYMSICLWYETFFGMLKITKQNSEVMSAKLHAEENQYPTSGHEAQRVV